MFDINTMTNLAAIALFFAGWAVMLRLIGDADPAESIAVFGRPWEPVWPRGVQEEEPFHWHVERFDRLAQARSVPTPQPLPRPADCDDCVEEAAA